MCAYTVHKGMEDARFVLAHAGSKDDVPQFNVSVHLPLPTPLTKGRGAAEQLRKMTRGYGQMLPWYDMVHCGCKDLCTNVMTCENEACKAKQAGIFTRATDVQTPTTTMLSTLREYNPKGMSQGDHMLRLTRLGADDRAEKEGEQWRGGLRDRWLPQSSARDVPKPAQPRQVHDRVTGSGAKGAGFEAVLVEGMPRRLQERVKQVQGQFRQSQTILQAVEQARGNSQTEPLYQVPTLGGGGAEGRLRKGKYMAASKWPTVMLGPMPEDTCATLTQRPDQSFTRMVRDPHSCSQWDARKHDTHRGSGVYLTVVCADTTTGCNMAAGGVGAIRCKGRTRALRDVHHGP